MKLLRLTGPSDFIYYVNMDRVQVIVRGAVGTPHEGTTTISFAGDETFTVMETPEEIYSEYQAHFCAQTRPTPL